MLTYSQHEHLIQTNNIKKSIVSTQETSSVAKPKRKLPNILVWISSLWFFQQKIRAIFVFYLFSSKGIFLLWMKASCCCKSVCIMRWSYYHHPSARTRYMPHCFNIYLNFFLRVIKSFAVFFPSRCRTP